MITDDALAALQSNDARLDNLFLYLDDYSLPQDDEDEEEPITRALAHNTRVTAVDCDMHVDIMTHTLGELMASIGRLSNLQRLRCSSSGDYAVTMAAMAKALQATTSKSQLTSLDLANFLLSDKNDGDDELAAVSYKDFVDTLKHHPSLENVSLGFGFSPSSPSTVASSDDTAAHGSLTPLLQSLRMAPNLQSVRLDGARFASPTALSPDGLAALLQAPSRVSSLEVHDFDLSPAHIEAVSKALTASSHLKTLSIACHKYTTAGKDTKPSATAISSLSAALRSNTTLETLQFPQQILLQPPQQQGGIKIKKQQHVVDLAAMMELLQALQLNATLQKLHVTTTSTSSQSATTTTLLPQTAAHAFRTMMQNNYGLREIQLLPWFDTPEWQAEVQLYTKLNAMGRGRLVRTRPSNLQWMDALGQVQDDVSCLFHLLLLNPLLCSSGSCSGS